MFSAPGTYPAVGLFSRTHIIAMIICFILIGVAVVFTRKMKKSTFLKFLKILAIVVSCLELFKIIWSLANGQTRVNNWVPLYFCSIFIYSLWFTWSKNDFIKEMGYAFIALAGAVAGAVFIISPSTSFNTYPIFHFQCLYSMVYHSLMVYCGIMIHVTKSVKVDIRLVIKYCLFCAVFMTMALIINLCCNSNLMFISTPSGIPLPFLFDIYNVSKALYTIIIIIAHLSIGFIVYGLMCFINLCKRKSDKDMSTISSEASQEDDEDEEVNKKHV